MAMFLNKSIISGDSTIFNQSIGQSNRSGGNHNDDSIIHVTNSLGLGRGF